MSTRKAIAWTYGAQLFNFLISFGSSIVIARLLVPRDFGIYAVANALLGILAVFTSFGVATYVVRETELNDELLRSAFTVNAMLALLLSAALAMAGLAGEHLFRAQEVGTLLLLLSLGPFLGILEFLPATLATREMRFHLVAKVTVLKTGVLSVTTILFAAEGYRALSFGFGSAAAALSSVVAWNILHPRGALLRPSLKQGRKISIFGAEMISIGGVAQLAARGSDLILGQLAGLTALGLYARASSLANLAFYNLYGSATSVLFVRLSHELRDRGTVRETYLRAFQILTSLMWPLLLGCAVLAGPLIHTLYGPKWVGAAVPLSLLMLAFFVVVGFAMNWELFVLGHETRRQTRFELARASAGTIAFTIGASFGIVWAAVGRVMEALVGFAIYRPHLDRLAGLAEGELNRVYGRSLLLAAVAVAPSFALMVITGWAPDTPLVLIAPAVALGTLLWAGMLFLQEHPLLDEARRLAARFRPAPRT